MSDVEIKQGIDFTDQGHRILVFYGDNKKQELQESIDNFTNTKNDKCLFAMNPLAYICDKDERNNKNHMLINNIKDINNINTEGLEYYDIDGSEERITSTPKLETIYIQDSKNKELFVPENLYNQYICKKKIEEITTCLSKFAPIELKITPIKIVYDFYAQMKTFFQSDEQTIKLKPSCLVEEQIIKFTKPKAQYDKDDDSKVPDYLKHEIDLIRSGLIKHDNAITVQLEMLEYIDICNQKVNFYNPMNIANVDVILGEQGE